MEVKRNLPEKKRKLPYGRQWIDDDDVAAVTSVLESDYLTTGPACAAFEEAFAEVTGGAYAVAVSSGTAGLHLAMKVLGIGSGDAVIVPAITFLASANCVEYVGAHTIFADVDPNTGLMELEHIKAAYAANPDRNIKAIIPVHLNGQTGDLEVIEKFAREHGFFVVEDACHALGTRFKDSVVGDCKYSDMAVFSAHPVKTIAMGEGGVITTKSGVYDDKLKSLRAHGMIRDPDQFENAALAFSTEQEVNCWYYEMHELGYNYRASDIHCALGLSQLKKLDTFVAKRQELVGEYLSKFDERIPYVKPLRHTNHGFVGWHLFPVLCDFEQLKISRNQVMKKLAEVGIYSQVHYIPVPSQPYYQRKYGTQIFGNANIYYEKVMALPLYPTMELADVEYVMSELYQVLSVND